jgi:D-serine ammonia-lyase
MAPLVIQTKTYDRPPQKQELLNEFAGKSLKALRTPAMIIDRNIFAQNCARMHEKAAQWGANFRAHLKTHKVSSPTQIYSRN